jgi:hypothetical protein
MSDFRVIRVLLGRYSRTRALILCFCAVGMIHAQTDPEISAKRAASFHLLALSQAADVAVKNWLTAHPDKAEDMVVRRYIYGDIDGDGAKDLLLVTSLARATGNYWSIDFVLIRARSPEQPIIFNFGGVDVRSYEAITMGAQGIVVDALYYGPADADCCPSIKKKVLLVLKKDRLIEQMEK